MTLQHVTLKIVDTFDTIIEPIPTVCIYYVNNLLYGDIKVKQPSRPRKSLLQDIIIVKGK